MKEKAYAKINLVLDVNKKLENGYHDISFLMTSIDLFDMLEVRLSKEDNVVVVDNVDLSNENNLAFKALKLIKKKYDIKNNYEIIIKKNIPIAAGMAGGSSNAAAVLRAINKLEKLNLTLEQLAHIGIEIGADVPFCIYSSLAKVRGIGEKVELLNYEIPKSKVLVINPGIELSTKKVYDEHVINKYNRMSIDEILQSNTYDSFYKNLRNDLEATAEKIEPEIKKIKKEIEELNIDSKVMVSGSGPTILVFDKNIDNLLMIKEKYKSEYKYVEVYDIL